MTSHMHTIVLLGHAAHGTEYFYGTRDEAERRLDELIQDALRKFMGPRAGADIEAAYLYGPEGLINSWRKP